MTKQIEIKFKNNSSEQFRHLLIDYFYLEKSPLFPIAIDEEDFLWISRMKDPLENLRIVEVSQDGRCINLASILCRDYHELTVIIIESDEGERRWVDIQHLVVKIIDKAKTLQFQIISIKPEDLYSPINEDEEPLSIDAITPVKRPPGRPRHPDDIWAWEQVNVMKRNFGEVKSEWLLRSGVIARNLNDIDRAFRNAVNYKKRTK
jgi:hypothetical protein